MHLHNLSRPSTPTHGWADYHPVSLKPPPPTQPPWSGADCSVQPAGGCEAGSLKPIARPEANGTCWHACTCHTASQPCSYDSTACANFTCDAPLSGARLRLAPDGQRCVADECSEVVINLVAAACLVITHCVQAMWVAHGDHGVCRRACNCAVDGGCTLAACELGGLQCSRGWVLVGGGGEAPRCVPEHCTHGGVEVC